MIEPSRCTRRAAIGMAFGASVFGLLGGGRAGAQSATVPWSTGTNRPSLKLPPNATDCHHHVYDSRFPIDSSASLKPGDATVADYRLLQARLGTARNVVVQPSTYGVDNSCLVDALRQFGLKTSRGVAVVNTAVTEQELRRLNEAGVRGIRFNLSYPGSTTPDMMEPLAKRIHQLGWHIQIVATADQLVAVGDVLRRLPTPVVFDHLAHLPQPQGTAHPAFALAAGLIEKGRAWVKLSGAYIDSKLGPPSYADIAPVARAFVELAPERCVWGSDWPHPTLKPHQKPDDAALLDLLAVWAPDDATRHRILVDNPAALYGFS